MYSWAYIRGKETHKKEQMGTERELEREKEKPERQERQNKNVSFNSERRRNKMDR